MAHIPINHPLQPLYRTLAGLIGLYLVAFGIAGWIEAGGLAVFAREGLPSVLGLHTNRAFAILSLVVGLVLVFGAVVGGSLDERINLYASIVFLVAGLAMLILLRSDWNILGFTVTTCVVSFVFGMVLFTAGLYGKVGTAEDVRREEAFRHGRGSEPDESDQLTGPNPPQGRERVA